MTALWFSAIRKNYLEARSLRKFPKSSELLIFNFRTGCYTHPYCVYIDTEHRSKTTLDGISWRQLICDNSIHWMLVVSCWITHRDNRNWRTAISNVGIVTRRPPSININSYFKVVGFFNTWPYTGWFRITVLPSMAILIYIPLEYVFRWLRWDSFRRGRSI